MALAFPSSAELRAGARRMLRPKTKLGKVTLWFGCLAALLGLLKLIFRSAPGTMLTGWAEFTSFIFIICALLLGVRWVRRKLMWRLRNRLIVTYVFIGVIPVLLLVAMALLAGSLFAGQFASYVAVFHLQSELQHLAATNRSLTTQFATLARDGKLNPQLAGEIASASSESFRHRSVSVWEDGKGFLAMENGVTEQSPIRLSPAIIGDFAGIVVDTGRPQLRAIRHTEAGAHHLTVISNLPITPEVLRPATSQIGSIGLFPVEEEAGGGGKSATSGTPAQGSQPDTNRRKALVYDQSGESRVYDLNKQPHGVQAGSLPPAAGALDYAFPFGTRFNFTDWSTGKNSLGLLVVETRPSRIYATLFSTFVGYAEIAREILIGIAIFFGVIELIALFIGVRLTRSMTRSVGDLYAATERVNRGDLSHQIRIRTHDQMAALEQSFNSMTRSLSNLIAEQKEKQRMESELAIAHEVQALLFPADLSGLPSLEVHGVCRPARTVSGDYYDFIPLSDARMVLAVGDISGKGISAALLMATVHAFVRAYAFEPERTLASVASGGRSNGAVMTAVANGSGEELCPATLMATLNYQLFRSTPPEKYATMFLACYDTSTRSLTYSNAGHLPPLLLDAGGGVRRLETSGTVVGLFDGMSYDKSAIAMRPGDIFVAYSDGVTEPENEFGEFGEARLMELIAQHRDQSLARISDVVTSAVTDWIAGGEQPDDVTLVLARAR